MQIMVNSTTLSLIKGDITQEETDAIVNAANARLAGGGGVDGAIHRAGGPKIMEECRKIGGCPAGSAVITTGGNLKAKYVIHTVGPIYRDGRHDEPKLLANAYKSSLEIAVKKGIKTIAFPSISTGAYGYPINEAAETALKTAIDFIKSHKMPSLVRFVLFSDRDLEIYEKTLERLIKEERSGVSDEASKSCYFKKTP
ncbi:MAG: O-acetyl-ADP-ribose deacetylase [Deltaproteobacteria bacterium]|nr:O-acetyl-ADP-ribose deacetylase [Deltaproteobacteria bacterium]